MTFKEEDIKEALACLSLMRGAEAAALPNTCEIDHKLFQRLTDLTTERFESKFDDYNNWIFEDDYDTEAMWNKAKKDFVKKVIEIFILN